MSILFSFFEERRKKFIIILKESWKRNHLIFRETDGERQRGRALLNLFNLAPLPPTKPLLSWTPRSEHLGGQVAMELMTT